MGQVIIQLLRGLGVRVAAVSRSEAKLDVARMLGAEAVWRAGGASIGNLSRGFSQEGIDVVFDCVGSAESMKDALAMVKRCGRIVMVGEEDSLLPASSTLVAQHELEIVGSRNGSRRNMEASLRFLAEGVVKPVISDIFPLEEANEAIERVRRGASGRVVLKIG